MRFENLAERMKRSEQIQMEMKKKQEDKFMLNKSQTLQRSDTVNKNIENIRS